VNHDWVTCAWHHTKVKDVEIDSPFHRNFKRVQKIIKTKQLTPDLVHTVFLNTKMFGHLKNWPTERIFYGLRSRTILSAEALKLGDNFNLKKLLRSNKNDEWKIEARLQKKAAKRRAITPEEKAIDDYADTQRSAVASEASGKNFCILKPRGATGDAPGIGLVLPRDYWETYPVGTLNAD